MQYQLTLYTSCLTLPFACQYQMQSMVYSLLQRDGEYGATLHPTAHREENQAYVPFCFGEFSGRKTVDRAKKQFTFSGELHWELRTADPRLDKVLCRVLTPGLELTLCGQPLTLKGVEQTQRTITAQQCKIRMLTPMLAYERTEDKKTIYYNPLSPEFVPLVAENFRRKYAAMTGEKGEQISIRAQSVGERDKSVTRYKNIWMTGWKGEYLLTGKPEALTFLYNSGLGQRNAAGFGLFEVMRE
jgi:CRISPR-associated endoribonuclease Cas6